jgi:hypothetical protein
MEEATESSLIPASWSTPPSRWVSVGLAARHVLDMRRIAHQHLIEAAGL